MEIFGYHVYTFANQLIVLSAGNQRPVGGEENPCDIPLNR